MKFPVPQEGVNAFGYPILPVPEILSNPSVYEHVHASLVSQFLRTGVEAHTVEDAVVRCLAIAKTNTSLETYAPEAHTVLEEAGILAAFVNLTSARARTMADLVRPYLTGRSILDLGCGTGKVSEVLAQYGFEMNLADVYKSPYIEERLAALPFSKIDQNAALPFEDNSFDNVLVFAMLHHTENPLLLLREARRILTATGRFHLIETVFGVESEKGNDRLPTDFLSLSSEEQRLATMFLDYFGNHVTWYFTTNPEHLVPVPFNFNTPTKWKDIFDEEGYRIIEEKNIGIDPNSGVYHVFFSLEKED